MKTVFTILIALTISFGLKAQNKYNINPIDTLPKLYLGLGTGIDNYTGMLGLNAKIRLYKLIYLRAGAGFGGWGTKLAAGLLIEQKPKSGWAYALTFTSSSGAENLNLQMEVSNGFNSYTNKTVTLDLDKANSLNLSLLHIWKLRKNKQFNIEFGYALPLSSDVYTVKDNSELSNTSIKTLNMMQPGGVILAIGFMFGM
ncbi:MAG: hypothetical protein KA792_06705 [Bacteroidales bacterium]|nr:hypothetical protein [Bacteroidales bacterium]